MDTEKSGHNQMLKDGWVKTSDVLSLKITPKMFIPIIEIIVRSSIYI